MAFQGPSHFIRPLRVHITQPERLPQARSAGSGPQPRLPLPLPETGMAERWQRFAVAGLAYEQARRVSRLWGGVGSPGSVQLEAAGAAWRVARTRKEIVGEGGKDEDRTGLLQSA